MVSPLHDPAYLPADGRVGDCHDAGGHHQDQKEHVQLVAAPDGVPVPVTDAPERFHALAHVHLDLKPRADWQKHFVFRALRVYF